MIQFSNFLELGLIRSFQIKIITPMLQFDFGGQNEIAKVFQTEMNYNPKDNLKQSKNFRIGIKQLLFIIKVIKEEKRENITSKFNQILKMVQTENDGGRDNFDALTRFTGAF